ncbi:MAG: rhomboid family intramembrane serine protease [Myxococcota bacterium]
MRLLHRFDDSGQAQVLVDALFAESINASVREGREGDAQVWVDDDDDVPTAQEICDAFLADPNDARFSTLQSKAKKKRSAQKKAEKKSRHRVVKARETFKAPGMGPVTIAVIVLCVFVAVVTKLGSVNKDPFMFVSREARRTLFMAVATHPGPVSWLTELQVKLNVLLTVVKGGEVWRLFSPCIVHFGLIHIGFNLWWWKDLGADLERVHSSLWLVAFTLFAGIFGGLCEYLFGLDPMVNSAFGGMSGVVYGLFGYIWIRGRFDPTYPLGLTRMTVIWMMAFYVLCFTNFIPIANWAHTGGLLVGMIWGFASSDALRRRFLRAR